MLSLISPDELEKRKDAQGVVVFRGDEIQKVCDEMLELFPDMNEPKIRSFKVFRAKKKGNKWIWSHDEVN